MPATLPIIRRPRTPRCTGSLGPQRPGANFVVGCLAIVGVLVVLGVIAAVILGPRLPGLLQGAGAEGIRAGLTAAINEMDLPADEKPDMIGHVDRVADGIKDGTISFEQFGSIAEDVFQDPIVQVGMLYAVDTGYLQASGLSDEEKAAGQVQLRRLALGIEEGTVERSELSNAAAPIGSNDSEGNFVLNEKAAVSDDQLRQVIANAERLADQYEITDEPRVIDLSDEFGRIIDESLGINSAGALPAGESADTPDAPEAPDAEDAPPAAP